MDDFDELRRLEVLQLLAAAFQFLEGLDRRLGHPAVRLFRSTHDGELLALGDPFVAVLVVEADAQQPRLAPAGLLVIFNAGTLPGSAGRSSGIY